MSWRQRRFIQFDPDYTDDSPSRGGYGGEYDGLFGPTFTPTSPVRFEHHIEYSPSGRAGCRARCAEGKIGLGVLRYGKDVPNPKIPGGKMPHWWHWTCVPSSTLRELRRDGVERAVGFRNLRFEDQERVRKDVAAGRVDLSYQPPEPAPSTSAPSSPTKKQKKRKHEEEELPIPSQREEREEDIDNDDVDEGEFMVEFRTDVVGTQYYNGLVGADELVRLERDPTNAYDPNAIQIMNASNIQVGHLSKAVAARLGPLMDAKLVTVEGIMETGNLTGANRYKLRIILNIYAARSDYRLALENELVWATPGQRGFGQFAAGSQTGITGTSASPKKPGSSSKKAGGGAPSAAQTEYERRIREAAEAKRFGAEKAAQLRRILSGLESVNDEGRRASLLDNLLPDDILDLPLHPDPPSPENGQLKSTLLKHQSQALAWCIDKEYPNLPTSENDKPVQFWKYAKMGAKTYYYNVATKQPQEAPPTLGRGAFMADSMGLGKTLTMLSLILATHKDVPTDHSNSTLIVVPLSVISNWESQIMEHLPAGALSVYTYHGSGRGISAINLAEHDIVLTTYNIVGELCDGADVPMRKKAKVVSALSGVKWKRVILDEGHTVRNAKTKMSRGVCSLTAQRRWVVTGTPIVNTAADLGALLQFLRTCRPLDDPDYFKRLLARPLAKGEVEGADLLKALMTSVCLRRTKEMRDKNGQALVPLPGVEVIKVIVTLAERERKLYDDVSKESQKRVNDLLPRGVRPETLPMGVNLLSLLTRLRQLALHSSMVPTNYLEDLRKAAPQDDHPHAIGDLTKEEKTRLRNHLYRVIQDNEECPVCFDELKNGRILPCNHFFCLECITGAIAINPTCPMDRRPIKAVSLLEPLVPAQDGDEDDSDNEDDEASSSKINELIKLLNLLPSTDKSLVFSQFTSYLDHIQIQLKNEGIPYVRFDGSMSPKQRKDVIESFSRPLSDLPDVGSSERGSLRNGKARADAVNPTVMLISLKAGALGLNLVAANHVFLMDPWWQSEIESQAIDRVNRIGQTKPVRVYQMIAEDTVESRVLDIQDKKKALIQQAFSGIKSNETHRAKKEARLQEVMTLLGRNV